MSTLWSGRFADAPDEAVFRVRCVLPVRPPALRGRRDGQPGLGGGAGGRGRAVPGEARRHRERRSPPSSSECRRDPGAVWTARTRTCTPSSSACWWSASARRASGCTPGARATSRSRSTCASTCGAASPRCSWRCVRLVAACVHRADGGRRRLDARLHAPAARPARARRALLAGARHAPSGATTRRLSQARDEAGLMPLGSGAVAGTAYAIDTAALASRLGFDGVVGNSLDATVRSGLRLRVPPRRGAGDGAPQPARGGRHRLRQRGVRLLRARRPRRHGQQPDAAEEEPGPAGARARQGRPRDRSPHRPGWRR